MVNSCEQITELTSEQREKLISKLERTEFELFGTSIYVKFPRVDHPKWGENNYLPVACVWKAKDELLNDIYFFELVNTDEKFPEDYHSRLKEICKDL